MGDGCPQRPGPTNWGDGESCPRGGWCLWSACGGWLPPSAQAHRLGGRGLMPRRRSLPEERLRGMATPKGAGPQAGGTGSSARAVIGRPYTLPQRIFDTFTRVPTARVPTGSRQILNNLHTILIHSKSPKRNLARVGERKRGMASGHSTSGATPPARCGVFWGPLPRRWRRLSCHLAACMAVLPHHATTTLHTAWALSVVLCCLATALATAERPTCTVTVYSLQWASGTGGIA